MKNLEINYSDIGKRIRSERTKQNITQEKLAEMTYLSIAHISHIETGNTKLSLPTIVKIANALTISVDELLCDSIIKSKEIFENEISDQIKDCTEKEVRIIADIVKATKIAIRKTLHFK